MIEDLSKFACRPEEQSQELPSHSSEEDINEEESTAEKNLEKIQNLSLPADIIVNWHKIRYTATRIKYSPTRIRSINFFSNISYTGINKNDFYNENFTLDVYVLLVKNLNPFSLSRKISDKLKQEMVYMLWRECIPSDFYEYICKEKNFVYLNGRDVGQPSVLKIVGNFIDQGKKNIWLLQESLARHKDIFQYVYSHVFPEIYATSEKRGLIWRAISTSYSNCTEITWRSDNTSSQKVHQTTNMMIEKKHSNSNKNQLKTLMNSATLKKPNWKKAEIQSAEKREWKEEKRAEKQKLKLEENKIKKGEMWNRINKLNGEFKKLKQAKKNEKKMSSTVINKL